MRVALLPALANQHCLDYWLRERIAFWQRAYEPWAGHL